MLRGKIAWKEPLFIMIKLLTIIQCFSISKINPSWDELFLRPKSWGVEATRRALIDTSITQQINYQFLKQFNATAQDF